MNEKATWGHLVALMFIYYFAIYRCKWRVKHVPNILYTVTLSCVI